MLLVLVAIRVVPATVVVRPLRGRASFDSCWEDLVAPGEHLAVCGPLGCLSIVGGRDSRFDNSPLPYRNPRNDGNCLYGGSCCRGDSRPLSGNRHFGGSPLSVGSRNRDSCHRRACILSHGSSHPPNRGCHLYIVRGDGVSWTLWELVAGQ